MALQTMYQAKSNSPQTTLTAIIAADATTLTVFDGSVLPPAPNILTLGTDENAEVVYYSTLSGNVVSGLVRGYSGTTASVWEEGTQVSREFTSYDHDTFITNINALQSDVSGLQTTVTGKQSKYATDATQWDTTPTASSTKPVTSGGIKTALDGKATYYTNITQLGFQAVTTLVEIVSAMANYSIFCAQTNSALTDAEKPISTNGVLTIFKTSNTRWYAKVNTADISNGINYEFATSGSTSGGGSVISRVPWKRISPDILYFYQQSTSTTSAATTEFCNISDSRITADTVVLNCEFTVPSAITSGVSWTTAAGYISLKGICTSSTCKVNLVLGQKGN